MIRFRGLLNGYKRFISGFGFSVVVVVCVGVITATAVWTKKREIPYQATAAIPGSETEAVSTLQENLSSVVAEKPTQEQSAIVWIQPVSQWDVILPYSPENLVNTRIGGLWQTHDGVDLLATPGEPVVSIGKGIVTDCGSDPLLGSWAEIDLGQGVIAMYSSLSFLAAVQPGDRLSAGQTIGFATPNSKNNAQPYIHLSVYQNGTPMDPSVLLKNSSFQ